MFAFSQSQRHNPLILHRPVSPAEGPVSPDYNWQLQTVTNNAMVREGGNTKAISNGIDQVIYKKYPGWDFLPLHRVTYLK